MADHTELLMPDEVVIYETRLHWWVLVLPAVLSLLFIVPVIWLVARYVERRTSFFILTDRRVILKTGWLSRRTVELMLSKLETVNIHQGPVDRMLGCGVMTFIGTGGTRETFRDIMAPFEFRKQVYAQIET